MNNLEKFVKKLNLSETDEIAVLLTMQLIMGKLSEPDFTKAMIDLKINLATEKPIGDLVKMALAGILSGEYYE